MITLFSGNYIARKPIERAMREFAKRFNGNQKVLDIGCGNKPYAHYFDCEYIGLDPFKDTKADVIAEAWDTPFKDNEFDGVILNQSFEHIEKTTDTIAEIYRIMKPGGLGVLTIPQTVKNHSIALKSSSVHYTHFNKSQIRYWQNDFYRFTKFGLISLFKCFAILSLKESSGYFGTISQLINYFLLSLRVKSLFIPFFFLNNLFGLGLDYIFFLFSKLRPIIFKKFYDLVYTSLTLNYIMIIKK